LKMSTNKNPYANPDGSPIDGKEPEFFEWEKNKDKERLDKLPEGEKAAEIEAQQDMNKRMQS
jgi:hypothetical protein